MTNTIQELADRFSQEFITATRRNGTTYIKRKTRELDDLQDLIYKAHDGLLPDDYRYQFTLESLEAIANHDTSDDALTSLEPDIYTFDLTAWLHSNNLRLHYVSMAQQEWGPMDDGSQILEMAQLMEKQEVFGLVLKCLKEILEDDPD